MDRRSPKQIASSPQVSAPARSSQSQDRQQGMTLTELLIVSAIVGILVAIALINFNRSLTMSRVARARADMRSLATALEAYVLDWGELPRGNWYQVATSFRAVGSDRSLVLLSSPIAYISNGLLTDPFETVSRAGAFVTSQPTPDHDHPDDSAHIWYKYSARNQKGNTSGTRGAPDWDLWTTSTCWFLLQSSGPDGVRFTLGNTGGGINADAPQHFLSTIYDPTNGVISRGSLYQEGGQPTGPGQFAFQVVRRAHY
jgi:prepilin-type N-terminal cleavage/methylation domain-containing protein